MAGTSNGLSSVQYHRANVFALPLIVKVYRLYDMLIIRQFVTLNPRVPVGKFMPLNRRPMAGCAIFTPPPNLEFV